MSLRIATHGVSIYRDGLMMWRAVIGPEGVTGGEKRLGSTFTRRGARRKAKRYLDAIYPVERFIYPLNVPGFARPKDAE